MSSLRMYQFIATLTVRGEVEAESLGEAERIAEGCIALDSHVQVTELSDGDAPEQDGSNIIDQMTCKVVRANVEIER